jgi:hypothetical protein
VEVVERDVRCQTGSVRQPILDGVSVRRSGRSSEEARSKFTGQMT